ncbi:MAG: signal peptidase II [Elusimicrobia bacterium]|nr:signal peptidase II [Elusimicrobiota bacterium]
MRAPARLTFGAIIAAVFTLDRLTKTWAQDWLMERSPIAIAPFFHLTYAENTGAAFSLLTNSNRFLIFVSVTLLAVLVYMARTWPSRDGLSRVAISLVIGGALGNLYDRVLYGFVVDFLDFRVWPIFNVADSCISIGAAILALELYRREGDSDGNATTSRSGAG